MSEQNELIVQTNKSNMLSPVDVEQAVNFWKNYEELTTAMLDESDYQISGKDKFKKKSAWRKYATAFNLSDEIIKEEITRDELGRMISAQYHIKVTSPNGRTTVGVGGCSIFDKCHNINDPYGDKTGYSNPENDIPATACTRAKNRAIADMIGAGEVTADEIDFNKVKGGRSNSNNNSKAGSVGRNRVPAKKKVKKTTTNKDNEVIDVEPSEVKITKVDMSENNTENSEVKKVERKTSQKNKTRKKMVKNELSEPNSEKVEKVDRQEHTIYSEEDIAKLASNNIVNEAVNRILMNNDNDPSKLTYGAVKQEITDMVAEKVIDMQESQSANAFLLKI